MCSLFFAQVTASDLFVGGWGWGCCEARFVWGRCETRFVWGVVKQALFAGCCEARFVGGGGVCEASFVGGGGGGVMKHALFGVL